MCPPGITGLFDHPPLYFGGCLTRETKGTAQLEGNKGAFSAGPTPCSVHPGSEPALGVLLMSSLACQAKKQPSLIGRYRFSCAGGGLLVPLAMHTACFATINRNPLALSPSAGLTP